MKKVLLLMLLFTTALSFSQERVRTFTKALIVENGIYDYQPLSEVTTFVFSNSKMSIKFEGYDTKSFVQEGSEYTFTDNNGNVFKIRYYYEDDDKGYYVAIQEYDDKSLGIRLIYDGYEKLTGFEFYEEL